MKKKLNIIIILIVALLFIPNVMAANIEGCKEVLPNLAIDEKLANTVHSIIIVIQVVTPILLVIFGMIDLVKGIIAAKEDEIKKSQQTFIKRLIAAAIVFFVIAAVKLLISLVADDSGKIVKCVNCFLNGADSCGTEETPIPDNSGTEETPIPDNSGTEETPIPDNSGTEETPTPDNGGTEETPIPDNSVTDTTPDNGGTQENLSNITGLAFSNGGYYNNIYYYNQNDYQEYYFSKDPENTPSESKTSYCNLGKGDCYQSIRSSGCGPTSLAMIVSTLLQEKHDPVEVTRIFCNNNGCPDGTHARAISPTAEHYNLVATYTKDIQKVINNIVNNGAIVMAHATKGDFTSRGHYINITGVNSKGQFYIMDSNNPNNNRWWDAKTIIEQTDRYYIITKK